MFLKQAALHGVGLDTRYAAPQTLTFRPDSELQRSWEMPGQVKTVSSWAEALIRAAFGTSEYIYIFPRLGAWRAGSALKTFQMTSVFASFGLSVSGDEVIEIGRSDFIAAELLLFVSLVHGSTVRDDIFMISDTFEVIMHIDHHEEIHVEFANLEIMKRYISKFPILE